MNTYDAKKNLGFFYCIKLIISCATIYLSFTKGNTLFQSLVTGLYISSVLTLCSLLHKRIRNVLGTILLLIVIFIAFIKIPFPDVVISLIMLVMMFLGVVYDCFQWVRLVEVNYDYKHGNQEKWLELERMVRSTQQYSAEEKRTSFIASVAMQKHHEGHELYNKMTENISTSEQIWNKLQGKNSNSDIYDLRQEYNSIISESAKIREYFKQDYHCSIDAEDENRKYEEMREYFNRFQRVRKKLAELQDKYMGTKTTETKSASDISNYFNGCNSMESLQKRYKDLCKVYHPDMGNGSAEIFTEIQTAYEILKKKYE